MQQQILGIVAPVPKGEWTPLANYQKLNIVRRNGASYMATAANTDIQPGVDPGWESYWMLLNEDGQGEEGAQGPAGPGVPTGGLRGEVLVKSSNANYDTEWVPQSQIAAGSAVKDGLGNNIAETYETKQHASQTYETKSDAATKNSNLQTQITQNQNGISSNTEQISEVQNSVSQNSALISRNAKRLDGLEQRINPSPFVTDSAVAYQKDVPENAVGAVEIQKIGGMTYKTTNLIKTPYVDSSKTENGITWTVNSDGSVRASGTATAGSTFVLCNSVSFGSSDVNALASNVTSGSYAFGNCAYNGTTQEVYLSVGVGETVSKTFYPIINIGASVAPYEPYYEGLRSAKVTEVKSVGVNLFGGEALANKIKSEVGNATLNKVNKTISYYASGISEKTIFSDFKPNTQYTLIFKGSGSAKYTNLKVRYTDRTETVLPAFSASNVVGTVRLVTDSAKSVEALQGVYYDGQATLYYEECGIFKGALNTEDFKPYVEHKLSIPEAVRPANGINENVYDYIEWEEDGGVKKTVKCGVVDLGTQSYTADIPNNYVYITALAKKDYSPVLCSHYPEHITDIKTNKYGDIIVYFEAGAFTSAGQVKAAMSGVMLVYELAEPEVTNISDLITSDNLLPVQGDGVLIFENANSQAVPSTVEFITAEATA